MTDARKLGNLRPPHPLIPCKVQMDVSGLRDFNAAIYPLCLVCNCKLCRGVCFTAPANQWELTYVEVDTVHLML